MPAGKGPQNNTMLYTLITFVGLFIIATTVAIIFYVKFEEQRTIAVNAESKFDELLSKSEQRQGVGKIVGTIPRGKSGVGTINNYLDQMISLILGTPLEDTSAEAKADEANRKTKAALDALGKDDIDIKDANGLVSVIGRLKITLNNTKKSELALQEQLEKLNKEFGAARKVNLEKEQTLLAEKDKYQQQVEDIKKQYSDLKALLEQSTEKQVQILVTQMEEERDKQKQLKQELLETESKLKRAENRMERTQEQLSQIVPPPDSEVAAFKPDGKIILIDDSTKTVTLNIGSDNKVYRGLTFTVYDRGVPIPKDGKGKAEIEVFNIEKNISTARIISSNKKNPVIAEDNIANLIWDSEKTNEFVIAGDFDINGDGQIDPDGPQKIKALIEKWGGKVTATVTIDTDFLVLGKAPEIRQKPSLEEVEVAPLIMEQYETSLKRLNQYKDVLKLATDMSIPVFNYERFLYFIGYKTQSGKPGAF
jgi:hypothetical protein